MQVYWRVTEEKQRECTYKGKHAEVCPTLLQRPDYHHPTSGPSSLLLKGRVLEGCSLLPRAVYLFAFVNHLYDFFLFFFLFK